jgi:hypothetical protein
LDISIGVSKMASRIINSGLADAHEASLQILLDFHDFYISLGCVLFFAYSISIFQSKYRNSTHNANHNLI